MTPTKAIDPARLGLSKSLMTTPCDRKGWYSEVFRDAAGRRLQFPMGERVAFGSAVDVAVTSWLVSMRDGHQITQDEACERGIEAAMAGSSWVDVAEPDGFAQQVRNAMFLYNSPNGADRIVPLLEDGLMFQGLEGESLRVGDIIGTPDFVGPTYIGDLKTWSRFKANPVWDGGGYGKGGVEMGVYSYLFREHFGRMPSRVFYQAYVRSAKPYWTWFDTTATDELAKVGEYYATYWRRLVREQDANAVPFNTSFCGDCPWREAIDEVGHEGCQIGRLMPTKEGHA